VPEPTRLRLDVETIAHGGHALAHYDARPVFVRHALPGEHVVAVETETRDRYLRADAVEVLRAAPERVTPPCPYAGPGRCGGCDFQHVRPDAQRALKASIVRAALARYARLELPVEVEAVATPGACEPEPGGPRTSEFDDALAWRTRVRFAVTGDGELGLRVARGSEVVPVQRCLIAHPDVEAVGAERRHWAGADDVEVIAGSGGDRLVVVGGAGAAAPRPRLPAEVSLSVAGRLLHGRPGVRERVGERTFWVGESGFWQVHPAAPRVLVDEVLRVLGPAPGETALDLYAGVGLFAAALGEAVGPRGRVLAVEADAGAVRDATQNLKDLSWVKVRAERVGPGLLRRDVGRPDVVVLDPPRSGAGAGVVDALVALGPRAVAYVACDPVALARDVASFATHGWSLEGLRAFDLFPMTRHVECVAALVPASGGRR